MFGELKPAEIESFLGEQLVGRIGCHVNDKTYVVPVSYAYDGRDILVHSLEGMKVDMMRKNPSVCFQVDDTRNLSEWKSVICWGKFEEIKDKKEMQQALQHLNNRIAPHMISQTMHMNPEYPFTSSDVEEIEGIFFRIRLKEKTGRFERPSSVSKNKY